MGVCVFGRGEFHLRPPPPLLFSLLSCSSAGENCTFGGLERLRELGFETDWLWYDVIALALYSIIVLTIAYIILSLIKKEK